MRNRILTTILTAALLLPAVALAAEQAAKPLTKAASVEARATVTAIDPSTRTLTLKTEGGETVDVEAGPGVKNFEQIKVGDVVRATYTESIAFQVAPKGETPGGASQTAQRVPGGAEVGQQVTTSFRVASVDPETNILWVTLPNGNTRKIQVQDPEAQKRLKTLRPGNVVAVTYTKSLALQLEKLAK
jgi:DNA-binding beta-propeller fold protein YncE